MLAKNVNDTACFLNKRGACDFFASKLAPTKSLEGVIPVDKTSALYLFQGLGNQERQLQRLIGIHPWVAMGVIAV